MVKSDMRKTEQTSVDIFLPEYQVNVSVTLPVRQTAMELILFRLLIQGERVSDIAAYRKRSEKTISLQKSALYLKLGIRNDVTFWRELVLRHNLTITALVENASTLIKDYSDKHYLVTQETVRQVLHNNELVPWYQPIISANTGEMIGCEVLMRRRTKQMETCCSETFITQVETSGLIVPGTCRLMELMTELLLSVMNFLPADFHVAVNVTIECVLSPQFEKTCVRFINTFAKTQHVKLVLELTERIPVPHTPDVQAAFRRLRNYGICIALDDFGTGYGGYHTLHSCPLDIIKLDKHFVQSADTDKVASHVVDSVVSLARKCGFKVTAEGIETPEQAAAMKRRDVDYLQGYLYSPPVCGKQFIREWIGR
ncbi:TPA: EAL domain-containing protein [Escherichia coli]|uniref:EAL domain-containing protein n=1 Tax=Escherichia coli TaxID=562 RepID=UPI0011E60CD4|nr:EAL domain-containing protein [Escherichia coli]EFA4039829.1 EAL domain-containing protein [Escherichia coli O120:H10]EFM0080828.1 EAL domain-containing protein [Escherichia coli]EIJ2997536.1 EAL domain-containing protein [Escherichia coli]MCU6469271.1 EAL domain-containing protein [Escherichia coli]HBE4395454.1 EAL domain-containing protein [Escherichia coli]